jgi:YVTN family beta-propeller protein
LTGTGQLVGTLDYLAPEQIRGDEVDKRADIYALGCVLWECLGGEPPFRRESEAATLWAHVQEPPPALHARRPELSAGLDAVVAKALAKEPSARYSTAGAFVDALRSPIAAEPRLLPAVRLPRRWRVLAVLAALALALALAGALAFTLAGGRGTIAVKPNSVAVIDAHTNRIVADVPVGVGPTSIAIGEGAVWAANAVDHTISRIDPKTREIVRTIPVASSSLPLVAAGGGAVWVTSSTGTVSRIDPSLNVVTRTATIGRWRTLAPLTSQSPVSIAVAIGAGAVWIGDRLGNVSRVDPDTVKVLKRIDARTGVSALAVGAGSLWAVESRQNTVRRISMSGNAIIASFSVGAAPEAVAFGEGAVWIAAREDDLVTRIDPFAQTTRTIPVGDAPTGIAVGGGSVWVANSRSGTVSRIDPRADRVVATIPLGAAPEALAFGAGMLWVTAIAGAHG